MQRKFRLSELCNIRKKNEQVFECGYDQNIFVDKGNICAICTDILHDPSFCIICCGDSYCKNCLLRHGRCFSNCIDSDFEISKPKLNVGLNNAVFRSMVTCFSCSTPSCPVVMKLSELENHWNDHPSENGCPSYLRSCGIPGCTEKLEFDELAKHVTQCKECHEWYHTLNEPEHKTNRCNNRLVECGNHCGQSVKFNELEAHSLTCSKVNLLLSNIDDNEWKLCEYGQIEECTRNQFQTNVAIQIHVAVSKINELEKIFS